MKNNQFFSSPFVQLFQIVNDVCCHVKSRRRRELDTHQFWIGDQLDKNITKNSQHFEKTDWVKRECKEGEVDSAETLNDVLRHLKAGGKIGGKKNVLEGQEFVSNQPKSRQKRENLEKRRTYLSEVPNEWTCTRNIRTLERSMASDFLGGGASYRDILVSGGSGKMKNRRKYKHTFIQQECCDVMGGDSTCDYQEIGETNLQEECCQEGCVIEEITENCGSWRWDRKEGW